jgi:ClpP class serine protease
MISNRKIDDIIFSGDWRIHMPFALQALDAYLDDLELLEKGVPLSELGLSKKREASLPDIFAPTARGYQMFANSDGKRSSLKSDLPKKSFAILKLSGVMRADDGLSSYGMDSFSEWLYQIDNNPNIAGTLIKGRSGGGEKMAGQILKNAIADTKKPVVVLGDVLGSAAVEGTLPADEVIASGTSSEFGSIGVYASIDKRIVEMYKKNIEDIYADASEHKNLEWREYIKGNITPLKFKLNNEAKSFKDEVLKYRPQVGAYQDTFKGGMFDAKEAKKRGLIDGIGSFNYALSRLAFHADIKF